MCVLDLMKINDTQWGKIYIIENEDYPHQLYVGSSRQKYLGKRYYRHKEQHKKGCKSYGNLFDTDCHSITCIEMTEGLIGERMRERERYYYDKFIAEGKQVLNQNKPWKSQKEFKELEKIFNAKNYLKRKKRRNDLALLNKLPVAPS